ADLLLTFDGSNNCTVSSLTPGVTATGSGKWEDDGAKKAWNQKDRDMIDLSYKVDFGGGNVAETTDNLIWQRSGVKLEEFAPIYNK
ncbi:MAG: adhesin, partial [Bacteroidaceae bacterium]|nr:adhesin [Bacteroidaceae bacterium]